MKPSTAKVYALLKVRGADGVSPNDARRWAGCDRLAPRIHEIKALGYVISHKDERNGNGGQHRRYFLEEPAPVPSPAADYAPGELMELWGK